MRHFPEHTDSQWRSREEKAFKGHTDVIRSVSFSPDGSLLASGSDDKIICLWRVENGKLLQTFKGHTQWIRSVAFSSDGSLLASGSDDNTVRLWRVEDVKLLQTLK